jgi:hypothetical protein
LPELVIPEMPNAPDWVVVWESARAVGDERLLAEQIPALGEAGASVPGAPLTDAEVWIQPGEYGYQGCRYDFAGPVDANRVCVWHPHLDTRQPLERVFVGGMAFMCCLDCAMKVSRHEAEEPELHGQVKRAREWLVNRAQRLIKRKLRSRHPVPDDEDDDDGIPF